MHRKIVFTLLLAVLFSCSVFGQMSNSSDSINAPTMNSKSNAPFFNYNKLHFSMNFGTGYVGGSSLYSGVFTSFSPNINYQFTPRLNIQTGVTMVSGLNSFSQRSNPAIQSNFMQRPNQFFLYTSGQYSITQKLSLVGSAYKTLNTNNSEKLNPLFSDYQGMNIGLDYKITKHMSIGTSLNITNNPYNLINQTGTGTFSPFPNPNFW